MSDWSDYGYDMRHEIERLTAAIERVKALHVMEHARGHQWCLQDQRTWPCPTIVALKKPS